MSLQGARKPTEPELGKAGVRACPPSSPESRPTGSRVYLGFCHSFIIPLVFGDSQLPGTRGLGLNPEQTINFSFAHGCTKIACLRGFRRIGCLVRKVFALKTGHLQEFQKSWALRVGCASALDRNLRPCSLLHFDQIQPSHLCVDKALAQIHRMSHE